MTVNRYAKWTLPLCAAALFLAGCGGGGVNPGTHDMLQMDYDATLADLMETEGDLDDTRAQLMETEGERDAAQAEVTRLTALIGSATDAANTGGSLYARINAAQAESTRLQGQLNTAMDRVTELTHRIGSAADPDSLQGRLSAAQSQVTSLTTQLNTANSTLATLRTDLATATQAAQAARQEAQRQVQQAQQQAAAQVAEAERTREANQRAQHLQASLPDPPATATGYSLSFPSELTVTVPNRGSLSVRHGSRFRAASLGGSGLRSVTMPLTQGGDPGKSVVYTDRELSRPLLTHFDHLRDRPDSPARFNLTHEDIALGADGTNTGVIPHQSDATRWRISHGLSSVAAMADMSDPPVLSLPTDAVTENTVTAASYTGYLYGSVGDFVCSGGTNCEVQIQPIYADQPVNGRFAVESVSVSATSGMLHFRPRGSPSIQLWDNGPVGSDLEYMVFGYRREDPTSPGSRYQVEVFANAFAGAGSLALPSVAVEATYDGIAVGIYVEQNQDDPINTHRQGEFVADVFLELDGVPADASSTTLTGFIDDFAVTPTGGSSAPEGAGSWVLDLDESNEVNMQNRSGTTTGGWAHEYVQAHEHAWDPNDNDGIPPAVTGTFNVLHGDISAVSVVPADRVRSDALHIIGAFGAHR